MEGKKKYVIAVVLFIFLGLMIFTFANPSDEDKKLKGDGKDKVEEKTNTTDDDNDNKKPVIGDNLQANNNEGNENNRVQQNNTTPVVTVDNSYELALKAVINAEDKIDEDSYYNAVDLVNRVTNQSQKEELETRLEEVKDGIDAKTLVEMLENKVQTSQNKDNMNSARDYRKDEEIINKVNSLSNEELKQSLQERLDALATLLDDTKSPTINIEDGAVLATTTKLSIEDANDFVITLKENGAQDAKEIANGEELGEGVYELTVVDTAFNEETITFTIDLTAPSFNVTSGTHSTTDMSISIDDVTLDYVEVYNQDTKTKTIEKNNEFTLSDEATYRLTAYDKAGHKTTVWVAIDKTNPTVSGVENNKYYKKDVEVTIEDKFLAKVLVNGEEQQGIKTTGANNEGKTLVVKFSQEGTYTIVATDKVGNTTTITFTIDKTKPVIAGVEDGKYYNTDVTPVVEEANFKNATLKLNGEHMKSYKVGDALTKEGTYTLVVTDLAMNKSKTVTFVIDKTPAKVVSSNILVVGDPNEQTVFYATNGDIIQAYIRTTEKLNVAPTFTLNNNGKQYVVDSKDVTVSEPNTKGEYTYTIKYSITESVDMTDGEITVIVSGINDLAGNTTADVLKPTNGHKVYLDRTLPTITVTNTSVGNGEVYSKLNLKLFDANEVAKVVINGKELSHKGKYVDINDSHAYTFPEGENKVEVTDKAGNTITKTFVVDKTAPKLEKVQVFNKDNSSSSFIKNGNTIRVMATFNEKLGTMPILTIGSYQVTFKEILGGNGEVIYSADIKILEDETTLKEGAVAFTITGHKDLAGNLGTEVTEKSVKKGLTYDRTLPTVTVVKTSVGNGEVYSKLNLKLFDANEVAKVVINGKEISHKGKWVDINDGHAYTFREGENKVEVTDRAGNTTTMIYIVDKTAPKVTLYTDNGKQVEPSKWYTKNVKAVIEDSHDYTAILTDQNGREVEYTSDTFITTRANYTLTVTDVAGNKTVVTFGIDKDLPLVYLNDVKYEKVNTTVKYFNKKQPSVTIKVTDLNIESIELTKNGEKVEFESGNTITEEGNYVITAIDKAGNKTQVPFVIDKTNPTFKPAKWSYTLEVDKTANFTCPDMASYVADNLSGVASVRLDEWYATHTSIPDQTKVGTFVCRYYSTDKAGNTVSNDVRYNIVDTTKPKVTVVSPNKYTIEAGSPYVEKGYSAIDSYDGDITDKVEITYQFQAKGTSTWPFVEELDTTKVGTYKVIYTATDSSGNTAKGTRVVEIKDTTAPEIVLPEGVVGRNHNELYIEAGTSVDLDNLVTATDLADKAPELKLVYVTYFAPSGLKEDNIYNYDVTNGIDTRKVGRYNLDYVATDSQGNVSKKTLMILTKDTTAPTVTLNGEAVMNLTRGVDTYIEEKATVTDNSDETTQEAPAYINHYTVDGVFLGRVDSVNTEVEGRYNLVYFKTDASGNQSVKVTRMVYVR